MRIQNQHCTALGDQLYQQLLDWIGIDLRCKVGDWLSDHLRSKFRRNRIPLKVQLFNRLKVNEDTESE